MTRTRIHHTLAATALTLALAGLTACAGPDEEPTTADDPTTSSTPSPVPSFTPPESTAPGRTDPPPSKPTSEAPAGPTLEVTVAGSELTPNAEEIDLAVGEELTITFTSDRAGELHVHSKPEQYVEFDEGTSTKTIVVETPGTVEVEEHESGAVLAVLTVS